MHTTEVGTANVPAFLTKLWKLVEDPLYNNLICWSPNGRSFIIKNQSRFSKELLPLYFKHNNMASFIRQLNMYGFRKLTSIENSGLKTDKDDMEFYHQYFLKDQEALLEFIKRKGSLQVSNVKGGTVVAPNDPTVKLQREDVSDMITDMKAIRDRQDNTDTALLTMQRENEALWREIAILRQKHQKQQQIVDKLIHFLVSLVSNRSSFIKRKAPLMIEGLLGGGTSAKRHCSSAGPVIHDVTDDVLEEDLEAGANCSPIITNSNAGDGSPQGQQTFEETSASPLMFSADVNEPMGLLDPLEHLVSENGINEVSVDLSSPISNGLHKNSAVSPSALPVQQSSQRTSTPVPTSSNGMEMVAASGQSVPESYSLTKSQGNSFSRDVLHDQIDGIDTELTWLQDQLATGGLNIDAASLLGLFTDAENMPSTSRDKITGNEMAKWAPTNGLVPEIDFTAMVGDNSNKSEAILPTDGFGEIDVDSLLNGGNSVNASNLPDSMTAKNIGNRIQGKIMD